MKYQAHLVNNQGCVFETAEFNNKKSAHSWASGRGGCKLTLSKTNERGERYTIAIYTKK